MTENTLMWIFLAVFILTILSIVGLIVFCSERMVYAMIISAIVFLVSLFSLQFISEKHLEIKYQNKIAEGYEVYLDGNKVEPETIDVSLYRHSFDDENHIVRISTSR